MSRAPSHDTLVYRLSQILIKLNQGERLDAHQLADEFGVNPRTIQRDLNERLAYLPLEKVDGRYRLDPAFLGKLGLRDIERFASLAGVRGLFPSLSDDFLRDIFDRRIEGALLVKGHHYENLNGKEAQFRQLERAIIGHRRVGFDYAKDGGTKTYDEVEPYKLVNHKGIWYLAAMDGGKLKTFAFSRLDSLRLLDGTFVPDPAVERSLVEDDGIWMGDEKKEIVIKVAKEVAGYFKRRKLIANQVVEKELEDGGLIVSAKVGHVNQVVPIVRYWIPHLRIISPEGLQGQMENEMATYIS
ncbi:Predicted DNA-binding transcriptional regulator YafY, contains an HTH and WYL domains [Methylomagnum ishizawai]|uniref:Predicted DNA-binding transcriptional regulator YafY, contains an HTH and WYL domains n=1 Tax=Methylomagnum ishizawai TaxID=1760988 RepID=A0A1Y6DAP8_9GAMM|nr:WYL domain-containing protein [Methylomagnum ishizawai]SMF97234.1 Predicted DNA-binding transcriptional regulator YafY, contains an HTH and WYL domains [Methylomagnum ishizawai]